MSESQPKLSRWDRVLIVMTALFLALLPLEGLSPVVGGLRVVLQIAIYIVGSVVLVRVLTRLGRILLERFLWRVRHRMIAVYLFVGFIPLALFALLTLATGYLLWGPLGAYMVEANLAERAARLEATAASLGWELRSYGPAEREELLADYVSSAEETYPGLLARIESARGVYALPDAFAAEAPPVTIRGYRGLTERENRLYLAAQAQFAPDSPSVLILAPLSEEYLESLAPRLGVLEILGANRPPADVWPTSLSPETTAQANVDGRSGAAVRRSTETRAMRMARLLPAPRHLLDIALTWRTQLPVLDWESGETADEQVVGLVTRPSAVLRELFSAQTADVWQNVRVGFGVLIALFGAALLASLIVGVSLTRTMTRAVHELYLGTERVQQQVFDAPIPLAGKDQLGALATSFNTMTGSIAALLEESKERQRLQAELDIAREVQLQMFPKRRPEIPGVEISATCRPARSVSGDFYDFVEITPTQWAIALGDVSGKGISAALVMATLHSILRTELSVASHKAGFVDMGEVLRVVNSRLHEETSPEKFSTLFVAAYDAETHRLSYANAGHLPPWIIGAEQRRTLEVTGLVVGVLPEAHYETHIVTLDPGDVLVAFTDGATEPENHRGEEFGEDRLVALLADNLDRPAAELEEKIVKSVNTWAPADEPADDLTLLVIRRSP